MRDIKNSTNYLETRDYVLCVNGFIPKNDEIIVGKRVSRN